MTSVACVTPHCWLLFRLCWLAVAWIQNVKTVLGKSLGLNRMSLLGPGCGWFTTSPGSERSNLYYPAASFQAPPQQVPEAACPQSVPWCMFMYKQQSEQVWPGEPLPTWLDLQCKHAFRGVLRNSNPYSEWLQKLQKLVPTLNTGLNKHWLNIKSLTGRVWHAKNVFPVEVRLIRSNLRSITMYSSS